MKRSTTLSTLLVAASFTHAQPVLTYAANAPVPGTAHTMHYGAYVSPGAAGANQTWNLSGLQTDSTNFIQLVQPNTTPHGASFPTATVSETGATATMYFRSAEDGMYLVGSDADLVIYNSDQARYLPLPCSYQTAWTDSFASVFDSDGFNIHRRGQVTGIADGYGTVIMPSGSVPNVLRIHWHEETLDSSDFFTFLSVFDSYIFIAPGRTQPLAQLVTASAIFMEQTITETHSQWVDELSTNVKEDPNGTTSDVDLYPVPASGLLNFTLPLAFSGTPLITITNASGRKVRNLSGTKWNGRGGQVDVSGLTAGVYQLMAIDELGHRAARTFIVE